LRLKTKTKRANSTPFFNVLLFRMSLFCYIVSLNILDNKKDVAVKIADMEILNNIRHYFN